MTGCTFKQGNYSIMSTKEIDFTKKYIKGNKKVVGIDTSKTYIIIPDKFRPMIDDALKNALNENCAEYLTEVEIEFKWWLIPYIYGEKKFEVKGYPWYLKDKSRSSCKFE